MPFADLEFYQMTATTDGHLFALDSYRGQIAHFDGSSWSRLVPPNTDYPGSVSASSGHDIYVIGGFVGAIGRYDGATWTRLDPGMGVDALWSSGPSDVWAVGHDDVGLAFRHYDGVAWTRASLVGANPAETPLTRFTQFWGSSSDLWTTDGAGSLFHWDGAAWRIDSHFVGSAHGFRPANGCSVSASDVWLGGYPGLAHYDGSAWSADGGYATGQITAIWGTDENHVHAVSNDAVDFGASGRNDELVRDATSWRAREIAPIGGILGLDGVAEDDIWAGGYGDQSWTPVMSHWNGQRWSSVPFPFDIPSGSDISSVKAVGHDRVWAAGPRVLAFFDGTQWTNAPVAANENFYRLFGTGADNLWAIGNKLYRHDGATWTHVPTPTEIGCGFAFDRNDVWVGGFGLYHFDGTHWTHHPSPGLRAPGAIWGSAPDDVYAVGRAGEIAHYDGQSWTPQESGTRAELLSVWGRGHHVFVGSTVGILRRDR